MTAELITPTVDDIETRRDRALRRTQQLHHAFQSVFETLTEIYHDEDWRYINDPAGHPYATFTAFVRDQLACAASNARRYQQGIVGLILPLREVAAPGVRIPVTSSDVARLGATGARAVVEQAPAALAGIKDPLEQSDALRGLIDSVLHQVSDPGFGPLAETPPTSTLGELVPAALPEATPEPTPNPAGTPPAAPPPVGSGGSAPADPADAPAPCDAGSAFDEEATDEPHPGPALPAEGPAATATDGELETGKTETPPPLPPAVAAAIETILVAGDPAEMAARITECAAPELASKCLTSGQRLVRLGQLLQTLG